MTTDDFTDDAIEAGANMTTRELYDLMEMDKPVLVKVVVGPEPETGVELEITPDPYDVETL